MRALFMKDKSRIKELESKSKGKLIDTCLKGLHLHKRQIIGKRWTKVNDFISRKQVVKRNKWYIHH